LVSSSTINSPGAPVRFKVNYSSPQALLAEFTRSVGRGVVTLQSLKAVPVGTQFVFELFASGLKEPVLVRGEVVRVTGGTRGRHLLHISYLAGTDRRGLNQVLRTIIEAHRYESVRKHPRVPLFVAATEDAPYSPSYVLRDISCGGLGVEVEAAEVPSCLKVGAPFCCEVSLSTGMLSLHGKIVWVFTPPPERAALLNPAFGVKFGRLDDHTMNRLASLVTLNTLPAAPWKARLRFGLAAVSVPGLDT
jgi:hypothetical protein